MKIKRFFIYFSTLIVMGFVVWTLVKSPDQLSFATYPFVYVKNAESNALDKEAVNDSLDDLSRENDFLIVKRIVQPTKEGHRFVYQTYGEGDLPNVFPEASKNIQGISSVFAQYIVVQGKLDELQLGNQFVDFGYQVDIFGKESVISIVVAFLAGSSLSALLILVFTFTALTLVLRIKDLRFAGIRLISGETIWSIIFRSFRSDFVDMVGAFLSCMFLGFGILTMQGILQNRLLQLLFAGLSLYIVVLAFISILLSGIYLLSLKSMNLISIIKGKLPLHRLLGIILFCQFIAIVVIGWGVSRIPLLVNVYQEQQSATKEWNRHEDLVNISFNIGKEVNSMESFDEEAKLWYPFVREEIEQHNGLLVNHNLLNYIFSDVDPQGNRLTDYNPLGNTLFVTPNYLKEQKISVGDTIERQLENLKKGQFGLLMPEKLKQHTNEYQKLYENYMEMYGLDSGDEDAEVLFNFSAVVGYLPNNQSRFIYNHTAISSKQFLIDPIIVIVTPASLGNTFASRLFWMDTISDYFYLSDFDQAVSQLKEKELYASVSTVSNSRQLYYEQYSKISMELATLIAGTVIGVATSVLLFNSMNLLYFEEFRRDIFIKRLSGLRFWALHQNYLTIQFTVILLGFCVTIFITKNLFTSAIACLFFGINALLILYRQMNAENKLAISVLKGK